MTNDRRRSLGALSILLDAARERGLSATATLARTGLRQNTLHEPAATLSFEQEFQIIRNLLRHCGDEPGLGLSIGLRYRFTSIAPVGFAIVSSPTYRSAFDVTLRYSGLNASLVGVMSDGRHDDLRIGYRDAELPPDVRRFAVERSMGAAIAIACELLDRKVVSRSMQFSFEPPRSAALYRKLVGVRPVFGAETNLLVLARSDVDAPLARANPIALRIAEEQCQRYLEAWRSRSGVAARVRDLVAMKPRNMPPLADIAASLHISERTLRRRLLEEGTSYSALCDETRQAVAEQLLTIERLPIEQIAERLGYSETVSFIHAFKRWKGQSPHAYRLGRARR